MNSDKQLDSTVLNNLIQKENKSLKNRIAKISHNLRAPIVSAINVMHSGIESDSKLNTNEHYLFGLQSLEYLNSFIKENIDFYLKDEKIENTNEISLKETILEVLDLYKFYNQSNQIEFEIHSKGGESYFGNRMTITTIINNLISNAVKYRDPDKNIANITISYSSNSDFLTLKIKDNGIGISKENRILIFQHNFLVNDQKEDSTGLGLSIVTNLVQKAQGSISVDSKLGEGTEFTVILPHNI